MSKPQAFAHFLKYGFAKDNRFNVILSVPELLQRKISDDKASDQEGGISIINEGFNALSSIYEQNGTQDDIVRSLNFMVESTELSGKDLTIMDTKYNQDYFSTPYDITYQPIEMTFKVSREMHEKNFFDMWLESIVNPYTYQVEYFDNIVAPVIEIQQLDEADRVVHTVRMIKAFPVNVASMPLDNTSNDSTHRLSVTFAYVRWENNYIQTDRNLQSLTETPLSPYVTEFLSNPLVDRALSFLEDQGIDLEGSAVSVYNQINNIVENTTGDSINKSVGLLNKIKASLNLNDFLTNDDIARLTDIIDETIQRLGD